MEEMALGLGWHDEASRAETLVGKPPVAPDVTGRNTGGQATSGTGYHLPRIVDSVPDGYFAILLDVDREVNRAAVHLFERVCLSDDFPVGPAV